MSDLTLPPLPRIEPPMPPPPVGPDRPALAPVLDRLPPLPPVDAPAPALVPSVTPVPPERFNPVDSLGDAREAVVGIPADLIAGRGTMYEIVTRNNRLRGIGIVLVLIALFAAVSGLFR